MASDNFTGADDTALETHDSNWTSINATYPVSNLEIISNTVRHEATWQLSGAYYNGSSVDSSQIVFKAGTNGSPARNVSVRAGSNQRGYSASLGTISSGNYTFFNISKNGAWLATLETSGAWSVTADHTVKITASGSSTVTIEGFVDGSSEGTTSDSSSPIGAGHPGFWTGELGTIAEGVYDDWTDGDTGGASIEESVSDLFKASDSQASLLKLEFANSDSFKLSEGIVAIGKLSNSVEDHLNVYEGVHRIIGVVDPTKMKLSAIEGRSFIDFSEAGSLTPHIGKRITILDWNGKKLVGFIKQAGTGETYSTIYQSDFSSDADGFYPSSCLLQGNTDSVGGEDNWLKFTIDDSLDYHWASKGGLTPKLAYYKITYKYYIPSSNSICNDIEFWYGNGQNERNLPTTLDAATQRVETFVPVGGETIYFALGNVNNGYYVQDSEGDDVFYVKDIVLEQLLTPSETGVTVDWAYQEEGFNYNEVNEYSYEIGGGEVSYGFPNEVVDLVTFSDLSSSAKWYIENISDLFKVSEGSGFLLKIIESVSDKALFVDSSTGNLIIALSVSDIFKLSDSNSKVLKFYENISDLIKVSDSSVNSIKFINLVEDVFKLSEDIRGHLALSFSPSDIAKFSDYSIKSLIIPFSVEDKFLVTDIAIATESGVYYFSVSDIIKASDSISVRKITSLEVLDVFELSDTGVVKKLSQVDVNDFLNLIDTDSIIKKTQFSISDIFELSDLGVTKKLSREEVSDFLRVIDNGESVKRAILEVSDKFKMSDYSIFMTLDNLGLVAIKLVYRGKNFLTLKERKDFTFKNRTSFFTTKKE